MEGSRPDFLNTAEEAILTPREAGLRPRKCSDLPLRTQNGNRRRRSSERRQKKQRPPPGPTSGELALTRDEAERVLHVLNHPRDRALISLTLATAMRREDVVGITMASLDMEHWRVGFYEHKKDRPYTARITGRAREDLRVWLSVRPRGSEFLFPSRKAHLSSRQAFNILQGALRAAGIEPRPYHALRGTAIKLMQAAGWRPEEISRQTGDSIRTIQRHYTTPSTSEMDQVAEQRPTL